MDEWLFEGAPALIATLDEDLICRHASTAWREKLGLASGRGELNMPLEALFVLEQTPLLAQQLKATLEREKPENDIPVSLTGKQGVTLGLLSAWRIRPPAGPVRIGLAATCNSELERALDELRRLRTMHELILNAAGEGIYGLDNEGRATFGNTATKEILGWGPDEVIGKKSHDVHHHSHPDGSPYPRTDCPIYAALHDGEIHRVDDEVFWHIDGSPVPVEYTSTPIRQDGEIQGAVVVFRDVLGTQGE